MSVTERLVHTILFELIALAILIPVAMFVTESGAGPMTILSVLLSLIAMAWNYIYNWGFDHTFGSNRVSRSFKMRLVHGAGFEIGMVITSFPVLMWMLDFSFLTVLMMDLGVVLFFFIYAVIFNWVYDLIRSEKQPVKPLNN